ncbi:hypothetical protein K6W59_12065 [Erwinia amylovora]|uniref:hypothetical protein n=1 Tax=Erwinia amylovora TaxID=552 RepID=UPI000C06E48E|nr:hypothetical protein [Erwinia amylovora]MBZ2400139.1 hypothetical protein [Erwinia amylovora]MBZ2403573.1 hypothetical protein [Erwinia amylovora]
MSLAFNCDMPSAKTMELLGDICHTTGKKISAGMNDLVQTGKKSFLSLVCKISNTCEKMKLIISGYFHSNEKNVGLEKSSKSNSSVKSSGINKISAETVESICKATIDKMNKETIPGMFRASTLESNNRMLMSKSRNEVKFINEIGSGDVSLIQVGAMMKGWCKELMFGRMYTMGEARDLINCNDQYQYNVIKNDIKEKLNPENTTGSEDERKAVALFSVFNAYRDICIEEETNHVTPYNEKTLLTCLSPNFFDTMEGLDVSNLNTKVGDNVNNAEQALKAILNAYRQVPPMQPK